MSTAPSKCISIGIATASPITALSCWVRVAMGWSGNGYGFSGRARIGTVVQVSYLNGDIDRPIITGCTYDGRNAPPIRFS
ncbi:Uncharacterized protein conserved in bacteria [Providencia stuartii]|nr:Uncharacterized protein conserved in bacteria [Providencia stuartii]